MIKNRVQLVGFLGDAPQVIQPSSTESFVKGSLATNESFKRHQQWETITEWHQLMFFGQLANLAKRLHKGAYIAVEGRLHSHAWKDKQGQQRRSFSIIVQHMMFLDPRITEAQDASTPMAESNLDEMYHSAWDTPHTEKKNA